MESDAAHRGADVEASGIVNSCCRTRARGKTPAGESIRVNARIAMAIFMFIVASQEWPKSSRKARKKISVLESPHYKSGNVFRYHPNHPLRGWLSTLEHFNVV